MKLTDKQKKLIWIAVAVLAVLHFAPRFLLMTHQMMVTNRNVQQKPPAGRPAMPTPLAAQPKPGTDANGNPLPDLRFVRLTGDWMGGGILPNRGVCRMGFELRLLPGTTGYTGYSTLTCGPSLPFSGKPQTRENQTASALAQMTPISTILSGQVQDKSIVFHVDQQIGTSPDGCPITGFSATPFGEQIAVSWQAGNCQGGNMIMQRVAKIQS
jgi:hypothetical protein